MLIIVTVKIKIVTFYACCMPGTVLVACQALCLSHPMYSHLILTTTARGKGTKWATEMHLHNL